MTWRAISATPYLKDTLEFNRAEANNFGGRAAEAEGEEGEGQDEGNANIKHEDGKTFENVGGMWIEVAEMDAEKMKHAEKNMGHASGVVVSKMKESEVMRLAREAVRDRDKFKDPETKKILKKFGLDVTSQVGQST